MRHLRWLGVLIFVIAGCAPVVRMPPNEVMAVRAPAATNPGKVVLIVVGVFSALLVLILVLEGNDISFGN